MRRPELTAAPPSPEVTAVLEQAQAKLGKASNMVRAMAHSPVVAETYLQIVENLGRGKLTPRTRELLALATAGVNDCDYCARAHAARGAKCGLGQDEIAQAVRWSSDDPKIDVALKFAVEMVESRGANQRIGVSELRDAGWSDGEIAEIIAVVALNVFPNYFNKLVGTDIDFPAFAR